MSSTITPEDDKNIVGSSSSQADQNVLTMFFQSIQSDLNHLKVDNSSLRTDMTTRFNGIEEENRSLRTDMTTRFNGIEEENRSLRTDMSNGFKRTDDQLNLIGRDVQDNRTAIGKLETKLEQVKSDTGEIKADVLVLKTQAGHVFFEFFFNLFGRGITFLVNLMGLR